jgi:3',5'-cyclic AMP phosphodiesterase CpdA
MKSVPKLLAAVATAACVVGLLAAWRYGWNFGATAGPAARAADAETWRPSRVPDRIVLTWTKDPVHTQAVTWRTSTSAAAQAQVTPADGGPLVALRAMRVAARTTSLASDLGTAYYHTAVFDDLAPKTKYAYRVGDGVIWSEWNHFVTAAETAEPFSFIYFGDAQNEIKSQWSRVVREAYASAPRARFLIHAGDLVSDSTSDAQWGEWFGAAGWVNAVVPCVPTPGNHEYVGGKLTPHWRPQFALPENGPAGLEETVYDFEFQGTRLISLNSNVEQDRQVPWLENVLGENRNRWTVVTFHHPLYSGSVARDNARLRGLWKPIFDKYRVDLVLQGHDHVYVRTGLALPENVPTLSDAGESAGGTVYVVSVSGPKMYSLQRQPFMQRAAEQTQLYQIVHIDGPTLRYEAHTADGELYDAFVLKKRPGMANELIEQIPETRERIRPATPATSAAGTR